MPFQAVRDIKGIINPIADPHQCCPGDHIQIALGEAVNWQLDPPDGVVLTHPVQNYTLVRGTQAHSRYGDAPVPAFIEVIA